MKSTMNPLSATAQESFSSHDAAKSALHAWKATAQEVKNLSETKPKLQVHGV